MDSPASSNGIASKPVAEVIRPWITRLPALTAGRRLARRLLGWMARLLVWLLARPTCHGLENLPAGGAALVVSNHLGNADIVVGLAGTHMLPEFIAKAELRDISLLGLFLRAYGMIWIHRGLPDRRALRAALNGLAEGRLVCIAPEGRESLTGALEEGTLGAAFLALKSGAPILPITFTGTENENVLDNLKRLRRTPVTLTVGAPFYLQPVVGRRAALEKGTQQIMVTLARQLPPGYRGFYASAAEQAEDHTTSPIQENR